MELNENVVNQQEELVAVENENKEKEQSPRPQRPHHQRRGRARRNDTRNQFIERVVTIKRVSITVKGGRRLRFTALVVIGDGRGRVGFGTGKANEVPDAIKKALEDARNNLIRVPMVKGDTIPHEIMGRFGACKVFLKPAPQGKGVVAGGPVRAVVELVVLKIFIQKFMVQGHQSTLFVQLLTVSKI